MSMHKIPLTDLEREGLNRHYLMIDSSSQLSDGFRLGMKWAQDNEPQNEWISVDAVLAMQNELNELRDFKDLAFLAHPNIDIDIDNLMY